MRSNCRNNIFDEYNEGLFFFAFYNNQKDRSFDRTKEAVFFLTN